jgi:hypothetical protein
MYKCIDCNNDNLIRVVIENKVKIGFISRILIFLRLKKNPNTAKIEYHCKSCSRVYTSNEIEEYFIGDLPYYQNKFLMTQVENEFYRILQKVIPKGTIMIPQVSLSSLMKTNDRSYRNKIDRKSVDFVLFKEYYFNPLLIIELDDSSHQKIDRIERDHFVDLALLKANLPIIHYKLQGNFNEEHLKSLIDSKMKIWNYSK